MTGNKLAILEYMRRNGSITQRDAIWLGCYRLSARIFDLKALGYGIASDMVEVENKNGTTSRVASYRITKDREAET